MVAEDNDKTVEITEDEVDESLEESFPASDPPATNLTASLIEMGMSGASLDNLKATFR
jgi:hypothetical protein